MLVSMKKYTEHVVMVKRLFCFYLRVGNPISRENHSRIKEQLLERLSLAIEFPSQYIEQVSLTLGKPAKPSIMIGIYVYWL